MLSNAYLQNYKQESSFSDYFCEQREEHKELSLPRFKIVKEFGKDVKHLKTFVPFIKERDQMNRLFRVNSESKRSNHSKSPFNHHHNPDGHWYFNENYVLPEKKKKALIKFNYQVAIDSQAVLMKKQNDMSQNSNTEESYRLPKTQRILLPRTFLRNKMRHKTKISKNTNFAEEQKKFQIQLPSQVLQPYINREMESMKQDLFLKVDMDYHFPSDLSDKLMQQKHHIELLRRRLKEWGETKSPEDLQDLKEYAKFILSKNI